MPQEQSANSGAESSNRIGFVCPLGTRDGTLTKDSKMVNCFVEKTRNGYAVVKRPGTALVQQNPAGVGQGQFRCNGNPYAIINNVIYQTNSANTYSIPSPPGTGIQYQALSDTPLGTTLLKAATGLWKFDGTTVTKISDPNYPAATVFGITYLDGTYYVMDPTGTLRGSALQDPTSWPALNFIGADTSLGVGVAVNRHLNYIQAFYSGGLQLYYDAGNATGSPLSPVSNASFKTGCASAESLIEFGDVTFFMSKPNQQRGRSVSVCDGLSLSTISFPELDRILNLDNLVEIHAFSLKVAGHSFYALTLVNTNVTVVYDTVNNSWQLWTSTISGVEQSFNYINYLSMPSGDYLQDRIYGTIIRVDPLALTDYSGPIPVFIRTNPYDWGTLEVKFIPELHLLADSTATTVSVRYSDDDYQTFSAYRTISLATVKKMLQRCGSSRRRSWDILHSAATTLKLYEFEINPVKAVRGG